MYEALSSGSSRYSVYLPYWYKSTQCTCFTGTKVQRLTHWKPQHNEEYLSPAILEKYLLYWYKSTHTDTLWTLQHNEEYLSPAILGKCLLYWYKSTHTDALWTLQHNEEYLSKDILEKLRQVEIEDGPVEASLKVSLREAVQRTLDIWY